MSSENREELLGLTGLNPEQRKQRLEEIHRIYEEARQKALEKQAERLRSSGVETDPPSERDGKKE